MEARVIGTVQSLQRYPVKSMAAETMPSAPVSWHGLAGDRRWAFVRPGAERSGFPWFTIREKPDLWRYEPRFADPGDVESSAVLVRAPDGSEYDVADPELAAQLGNGVRVMKQYSGIFDTFPLSLLTVQSVDGLSSLVSQRLTPLRFRPNIVVDASAVPDPSFPEDRWTGAVLRIGALRLRLDRRDKRCMMVNTDPATLVSNPDILRAIAKERQAYFGMYGTTVEPGEVAVDNPVYLER